MPQRNTFFPEAVDVLQGSGIENDYDPRITIRLRARGLREKKKKEKKKKGKKETRHGDLRANGWRRKMVGTMFHLARTFIVRAL